MNDAQTEIRTEQQEKIVDENKGLESSYVKFEKDKRKKVHVTQWRTVELIKEFEGKQKLATEWRANVVAEDGNPCEKTMSLANISFRKQVNTLLASKARDTVVALSIKRIGEGKTTVYDVELIAEV